MITDIHCYCKLKIKMVSSSRRSGKVENKSLVTQATYTKRQKFLQFPVALESRQVQVFYFDSQPQWCKKITLSSHLLNGVVHDLWQVGGAFDFTYRPWVSAPGWKGLLKLHLKKWLLKMFQQLKYTLGAKPGIKANAYSGNSATRATTTVTDTTSSTLSLAGQL